MALLAPMFEIGPTDSGVNPEGEAKTGLTGPDMLSFDLKAPRMLGFLQARIAPSGQYCQLPSAAALLQHSTQSLLKVET